MKRTLEMGQAYVRRIYNPTTKTYYLIRKRHDTVISPYLTPHLFERFRAFLKSNEEVDKP